MIAGLIIIAAALGCGRRGEPVPSSRRLPAAPTGVRLSAPAGALRVSWDRPRRDAVGRPLSGVGGSLVRRAAWPPGQDACAGCPEDARVVARVDPLARKTRGLPTEAWEDPDTRAGWTYRYRVRALDPEGRPGAVSGPADITWVPLAPPAAETRPGDGRVLVRLTPAPWPEGIEPLELRVYDRAGRLLARAPASGAGVTVEGLENGTAYPAEARVAGRTGEGWEVESPGTPVTLAPVDTTPPVVPATVTAFAEDRGVLLAWVPEGSEPYARVWVFRRAPGEDPRQIADLPGSRLRFRDVSAVPGTLYTYWIVVEDAAGNRSLPSREVVVRVREP